MNTETMSLRKALGQKKLLDKQIKAMMSEKVRHFGIGSNGCYRRLAAQFLARRSESQLSVVKR